MKDEIKTENNKLLENKDKITAEEQLKEAINSKMKELEEIKRKNEEDKAKMDLEWENEKKKIRKENDKLKKIREEKDKYVKRVEEEHKEFLEEIESHKNQKKGLNEEMKDYLMQKKRLINNFKNNEATLLEYQTLTFRQSKKIQEIEEEIRSMNEKFPEEISKYTKEIEFLKIDNENKKEELEYEFHSNF